MKMNYEEMNPTRARIMLFNAKNYLLTSSFSMTKGFFEALIVIDNALAQSKGGR